MLSWFVLLLLPAQTLDAKIFSRQLQERAVAATVRIVNRSDKVEGSGVVVGTADKGFYVLTTAHLVRRSDGLEISTFTNDSYPRPARVYHKVKVAAQTRDMRDLALIQIATEDALPGHLSLCPSRLVPKKEKFDALSAGCGAARAPLCLVEHVQGSRLLRRQEKMKPALFWEVKRGQTPGRSGGPLLDREGNLLGIASGVNDGKGYYCHVTEICRWLRAGNFRSLLPETENKTDR